MARRKIRRYSKGSKGVGIGAIAIVGGAILLLPLLVSRVIAGTGNPSTKINVNIYTAKSCDPNPTDEDPKDNHIFTYRIIWKYTEGEFGKLPYLNLRGNVTTVQASQYNAATVDLSGALDPLPYEASSNPWGVAPNQWTETRCLPGFTPCEHDKKCCFLSLPMLPVDPVVIVKTLEYVVQEDACLDCHYTSCQPDGHTVPKGGGICAPFKYLRSDNACTPRCGYAGGSSIYGCYYNRKVNGVVQPVLGKCYILIR